MQRTPRLSFLPPEVEGEAMIVDEIDFGYAKEQPVAPFKGSKFIVYPNQTSPLDIHDVKECWFVASGTGTVTYNNEVAEAIKQGDVMLFDSQQSHQVHNNGTENLMIFSVWWKS